jgi:ATP-binding cassette subfamily B multidrug efflux pump
VATPLRRLMPYHHRYRQPFWIGMFALVVARAFEAAIPLFLRDGIDAMVAGQQAMELTQLDFAGARSALAWPALAIVCCVLLRYGTIIVGRRLIRRIGVHIAYDLRKRIYHHLQLQGPAFFAAHATGDLMARAINDINLIRQLIGGGLRTIVVIIFTALIAFICMLYLAPQLTVMLLIPMPVIAFMGWRMSRKVFARSMRVQEGFADLSEQVQENLNGIRTVQALVQEAREVERFDAVNVDYVQRYLTLVRTNSLIGAVMPWLGAFCTATILGYGGWLVTNGQLTVGTFTAFFTYVAMMLWPVRQAGQVVTLWQQGASGTARLFEILDHPPEIEDAPHPDAPSDIRGNLSIRGLSYRYPGAGFDALSGVDLEIARGETIAILGRIGAGKTTLLKCFVRLLDPPPGTLLIDGQDVRGYPLARLRSQIVMVPQDPFLFGDLLRNNLSYDQPERQEPTIWQAAEDADLKDTIARLPDALETLVGERGVTLSGGQKQRSALTRGLIREASLLILDDCFSSVDTETEEHILGRLHEARGDKTTLMVSHRVSTARHADRIVVLDEGQVAEQGSHAELLAAGGWYAELNRIQSQRGRLLDEIAQPHLEETVR